MKLNFTILALLLIAYCGYSQQITIPDSQPLGIRSDANNIILSVGSGSATSTGGANTLVGYQAGQNISGGTQNTFVGFQTGYSSSGAGNTFLGYQAGKNNQSGGYNVFVGLTAGLNNTSGLGNLFLGQQAGVNNSAGNYNLFMGNSSGQNTTSGNGNTAIGDGAFYGNSTGGGNTAIGRYAGFYMTTGSNNTFIGLSASPGNGSGTISNATAIGYNAVVTASNSLILGSGANVGIGNSAPSAKLHITTGAANTSGLRLENLTSGSTPLGATDRFLSVDGSGNVVLATVSSSKGFRSVAGADSTAQWLSEGANLRNGNGGGVIIGSGVSQTPAGYRLYVADGILTEKVKVAVKSTADWSDKVFEGGYRLRSLGEVAAYIQQHKHLPGVPSANEVVEQGNDLHKTDAKLLEKIEELTLYMIELKQENQTLKQQSKYILERNKIIENRLNTLLRKK